MGKYRIKIEALALEHLKKHKKSGNVSTIKKIEKIIKELAAHPRTGIGNPEMLKFDLRGYWSRRINLHDRLIYSIEDRVVTVYIISAMGHYDK